MQQEGSAKNLVPLALHVLQFSCAWIYFELSFVVRAFHFYQHNREFFKLVEQIIAGVIAHCVCSVHCIEKKFASS